MTEIPHISETERRWHHNADRRQQRRDRRARVQGLRQELAGSASSLAGAAGAARGESAAEQCPDRLREIALGELRRLSLVKDSRSPERGRPMAVVLTRRGWCVDLPQPDRRCGRQLVMIEDTLALGLFGALLVEAVSLRSGRNSPTTLGGHFAVLNMFSRWGKTAGLGGRIGGDLPDDMFDRVEKAACDYLGTELVPARVSWELNWVRRIVGALPGHGHIDTSRSRMVDVAPAQNKPELKDFELELLVKRCMLEIRTTMRLIAACDALPGDIIHSGSSKEEVIAFIRRRYPEEPPVPSKLVRLHPELREANDTYGLKLLLLEAYPTVRNLVPFATLLPLTTGLNAHIVTSADAVDFEERDVLGIPHLTLAREDEAQGGPSGDGDDLGRAAPQTEPRLEGALWKARSQKLQPFSIPVAPSEDNPATMVRFLKKWTGPLRRTAPPELAGKLFLCIRANTCRTISLSSAAQINLRLQLKHLCAAAGIRGLPPKVLRLAATELVREATADDPEMVRALGNWKSIATPNEHYRSDASRMEEDVLFARQLHWREASRQVVVSDREAGEDRASASPGFICLDPFKGPLQVKGAGELCYAVGHCPTCPHARVDLSSAQACARLTGLARAIEDLRPTPDDESDPFAICWSVKWQPKLDRTRLLLAAFPPEVVAEARLLPFITYPRLQP